MHLYWQLKVLHISRLKLSKSSEISLFSLTILGLAFMQKALKGKSETFSFVPSVKDLVAVWGKQ